MSEQRKRTEVVSVRVAPDELNDLGNEARARGVTVSALLREITLARAMEVVGDPADPDGLRVWRRAESSVWARKARTIGVGDADALAPNKLRGLSPAGARSLAATLIEAADLAEQSNATDEAYDAEQAVSA